MSDDWDMGRQKVAVIQLRDLGFISEGRKCRNESGDTSGFNSAALTITQVQSFLLGVRM